MLAGRVGRVGRVGGVARDVGYEIVKEGSETEAGGGEIDQEARR